MSKTINDISMDLEKFPASIIRQFVKKMEASKAAVHHIKQVANDHQATQINLMRHQHINLPQNKYKKKQSFKSRPPSHKQYTSEQQQVPLYKKKFYPKQAHTNRDRCSKSGDSRHVEGFKCTAKKYSVNLVINMDILQACV